MGSNSLSLDRRRARWWTVVLLPALLLRSLIPAGFMLAPLDGRLSVILCDTDAAGPAHKHAGHDHPGHHHLQLDPNCPYAQSAGPAPLPALPALGPQPVVKAPVQPAHPGEVYAHCGPPRQQVPRGPPHFA